MRQLSPQLQPWLESYNQLMAELVEKGFKPTPINVREGLANLTRGLVTQIPVVAWVQDDLVANPGFDVPVRIYHPAPHRKLPVLVYYHGGGHMAGSVSVYDPICRKMALATQHIVVAPEYRLAPECPYPAGVQDAYHVAKYLWATLESRALKFDPRLSLAGDSAGGALCATVAHLAQHDAGMQILKQVLIYPSLDYTMDSDSMVENGAGYLLQKEKISWYFDHYFQHGENRRGASPRHQDFTDNLPETLVFTAEFCPLRDEGQAYIEQMAASTLVAVERIHFKDMIHAFLNLEDLVQAPCQQLYRAAGQFLNR
jgi:acetyl esterase/lipase